MLPQEQRDRLVTQARAAAARAFLTSPGGTAYGAAVLTASGNVYQAGQYSSFNHVTNVHAEQVALVLATMADDPDLLALAVASTGSDPVTRPCGVCRQVLAEHAARVGRDFEVLMAHRHGDKHDAALVSELLPMSWSPGQDTSAGRAVDVRSVLPQPGHAHNDEPLQSGDHITLPDGCVAMVWDGEFEPGSMLMKIKYAPADGGLHKLGHSFTEPLRYQKELRDRGWVRAARCGVRATVIERADVSAVFKALRLGVEVGKPPGPLMGILRDLGVDVAAIRLTGSRAIGLERANSDWDLVVPVAASLLPKVRDALATAIERGTLGVPPQSGTWKLLDRIFPGGREAALRGRRFTDTLLSGGASVALIFVPPQPTEVCVGPDWLAAGRATLHGKVVDADHAAYKRAEYELLDEDGLVRVTCYHKTANLLRSGDVISACGWLVRRGEERRLIQILPQPDRILWWEVASHEAWEKHPA
jgi:cytidine deaminase